MNLILWMVHVDKNNIVVVVILNSISWHTPSVAYTGFFSSHRIGGGGGGSGGNHPPPPKKKKKKKKKSAKDVFRIHGGGGGLDSTRNPAYVRTYTPSYISISWFKPTYHTFHCILLHMVHTTCTVHDLSLHMLFIHHTHSPSHPRNL